MSKIFILILSTFLIFFSVNAKEKKVYIKVKINNSIITNVDLIKEIKYLKILSKDLSNLDEKTLNIVGKNSLINEIIKESEIKKIFDLKVENSLLETVYKNFYMSLGLKNENEFENLLKSENIYSIAEIKKKLNIELYWNELIFSKYHNQIKIDEEELKKKINKISTLKNEYFISEIIFEKNKDMNLKDQENLILKSIQEIGFNNTANIYSISKSSKFGGKIGWIGENLLSENILNELNKLKIGENTKIIQNNNNYIILKIEDKRSVNNLISKEEELKKLINSLKNQQLNQFSNIFFNKSKINYNISEN